MVTRKLLAGRIAVACLGAATATTVSARHEMLDEKTQVDMMRAHDMSHTSMLTTSVIGWELRRDLAMTGNRMTGGGGMTSGDFGTATRTTAYDVTLGVGKSTDDYDFGAVLPLLYDRTSNGTTDTETGWGDLRLTASYAFVTPPQRGLFSSGSVMLKLPTADEDQGLGTGELDAGVSATVGYKFAPHKLGFTLGYVAVGDPPGIDYSDRVFYSLFLSRRFGDRDGGYVSLDGRTAAFDDLEDPVSFGFGYYRDVSDKYTLSLDAGVGLSDTAGDFYLSLGVSRWF